jgi:signal transduction histidine kinase
VPAAAPPKDDGSAAQGGGGGTAHAAAMEQLKIGKLEAKADKQNSVRLPLPDGSNWTRVKFWGVPSLVGFRYGKDHHAIVGGWIIEVEDNGQGIQPAMMAHLFELFHSTKGNRGTGIGLAVTKKIVEEHEGSISVRSAPGEGTTFTVKLPVYHETMSDPSHTHGPAR